MFLFHRLLNEPFKDPAVVPLDLDTVEKNLLEDLFPQTEEASVAASGAKEGSGVVSTSNSQVRVGCCGL